MKTINCPECGNKADSTISHEKTCINSDCDIYNETYLYHEWMELHNKKSLTVDGQVNELMAAFL